MNIHLFSDEYGPLPFVRGLPPHMQHHAMPQATAFHAEGPWGLICFQETNTGNQLLRHFLFILENTLSFKTKERNEGIQSLLSLKGDYTCHISGLKPFTLYENEFILFNAADADTAATIQGNKTCSLVNTYYPRQAFQEYLPFFPHLKKDLKKSGSKPLHFLFPGRPVRHTVNDAIQAIWSDKYAPFIQKKHIEKRLETQLFTLLAQTYTQSPVEQISALERLKAEEARELILKDISVHLTVEKIAAQLHCSAPWLKKAFSKVHGMGMFQFLRRTRMEKAKQMLLNGESLKIVALEVGMKPRNFPKEFKSYFGYTVSALKKGLY